VHVMFWLGVLKERDHLEGPGVGGKTILKLIFNKWHRETWTGMIWFRVGTSGGLTNALMNFRVT
jgi:hypothetical protein